MGQAASCGANYGVPGKLRQLIVAGNAEEVLTLLLAFPYLIERAWVWCASAKSGHTAVLQALVTSFQQLRQEDVGDSSQLCDQETLTASNKLVESCVNTPDRSGLTPLSIACMYGNAQATRWLLTAGADPYHADRREGRTAFHLAVFNGHADCCKVLLEQMPRVPQPSSDTPRMHHVRLIEASTSQGAKPIHFATECGHAEVVILLLRFRVDICSQVLNSNFHIMICNCGTTALHIAAATGDVHIAMLILKHYAYNLISSGVVDPRTIPNRTGMRPFQIAYLHNRHRLAVLLRCTYPFSWLFRAPEAGPPPLVPTLATLAAAALQADLQIQIEVIVAEASARQLPDARVPALPVSHQWLKRKQAQQLLAEPLQPPLLLLPQQQLRIAVHPNFVPDGGAGCTLSAGQVLQETPPFFTVSFPQGSPFGVASLAARSPSPPFRASHSGAVGQAVTPTLPREQRLAALYARSTVPASFSVATSHNGSSTVGSPAITPRWNNTLQASQALPAGSVLSIQHHLTLPFPARPASASAVMTPHGRHHSRASQHSLIPVSPPPKSPRADQVNLTPRWIQLEEITSGETFLEDDCPSHLRVGSSSSRNAQPTPQYNNGQQEQEQISDESKSSQLTESDQATCSEQQQHMPSHDDERTNLSARETTAQPCSSSFLPQTGTKPLHSRNSIAPLPSSSPQPHPLAAQEMHSSATGSSDEHSAQESQARTASLKRLLSLFATRKRDVTLSGSQLIPERVSLPPLPASGSQRRAPSVPPNPAMHHGYFHGGPDTSPSQVGSVESVTSSQVITHSSSLPRRRQLQFPDHPNDSFSNTTQPTFTPTEAIHSTDGGEHHQLHHPGADTEDPMFNNTTFVGSNAHHQALSPRQRSSAAAAFSLHGFSLARGSLSTSMRRRPASASSASLAGREQIPELILPSANHPEVISQVLTEEQVDEQLLSAPQLGEHAPAEEGGRSHHLPASSGFIWSPHGSSQQHASKRSMPAADTESEGGDSSCGICFEEMTLGCQMTFTGCGHMLCGTCAKALVAAIKASPATCPFCRQPIQGFREAGQAALVVARAAAAVVVEEKAAAAAAAMARDSTSSGQQFDGSRHSIGQVDMQV